MINFQLYLKYEFKWNMMVIQVIYTFATLQVCNPLISNMQSFIREI